MTYIKVNDTWQPAIIKSKSDGTWVDAVPHTKQDDYWDLKVEIYPSPFDPITNPQSITHPPFEGTVFPLHSENYYSYKASSTYFDISSTAFKVSIHDGAKYTSSFVYKCGQTKSTSPWQYSFFSVYGAGNNTGVENQFLPWETSSYVQFNYLGFGASKETKIKVQYTKAAVTSVDIGPYSKNKQYTIGTGADASSFEIFNVAPYDKLYVTVNNDLSTPLMVFANPLSPPVPNGALYLSAGIFDVSAFNKDNKDIYGEFWNGSGLRFDVTLNDLTFYLAPGAYMHGRFWLRDVSGIKFMGRGVIDANRESDPSGSWWENWSYIVPGMSDEKKLIMSPFGHTSSFADYGPKLSSTHSHILEGLTIVNPVIYANTAAFKTIDNAKLISQWPNGDGFRVSDWQSADPNKYASLTRSFMFVGDDAFFPNNCECNTLVSSNYAILLAATAFRTYFAGYDNPNVTNPPYTFSAINNDVRTYAVATYQGLNDPMYTGFYPAVFGLISCVVKNQNNDPSWNINNCLFSSIRIEGYTDVPLISIGLQPYPDLNSSITSTGEVYGNISSIIFADITAYSHPNSKYKYLLKNSIFASEQAFRPSNITFKNVRIDDVIITNNNKNKYFKWNQLALPPDNEPTMPQSYAFYLGSSIADLYFIIGDETADGLSGLAYELSSTQYASIGNPIGTSSLTIPGAYIFQTRANYTNTGETGFPKYSVIRPGINTVADSVFNRPSYGDMGVESVLMYKLKQDTDRDIYLLKMTRPRSVPVSGTYKYEDPPTNQTWSISATHTSALYREFITSAVSACKLLKNQYKNIDFKGGVIFLGNNPVLYENESYASSYVISDLSGLVSGIRAVFTSSTGDGPKVDKFYANIIWVGPFWSYNDYYNTFSSQLTTMDSNEIRFKYYQQPRDSQYYNAFNSAPWPNTRGYVKMAEDLYDIFKDMSKSWTNPDTNPGINLNFRP